MRGQAFEDYIAPATEPRGFWRMLLGLFIILLGWLTWTAVVLIGAVLVNLHSGTGIMDAMDHLSEQFTAGDPLSMTLMLLTFLGIWPAAAMAARWVQRRPFGTLISPECRIRWGEFWTGAGMAAAMYVVAAVIAIAVVGPPERSDLTVGTWALWTLPIVALTFFQASGEELIFRGYWLQELAALSRSPLVWAVMPALLFGLAHYDPTRDLLMNTVYVMATLVFGLIAALLVWRTGSLSAAMGLHTANNVGAISLTGLKDVVTGSQLWVYGSEFKETLILIDLALMAVLLILLVSPLCPAPLRERR